MTTDFWNGTGDWSLKAGDWSLGAPTSTTAAEIQTGNCTLSTSGTAASLVIDDTAPGVHTSPATLSLGANATLSIASWLTNASAWTLGSGDVVTVGGLLSNSGAITIGSGAMTASTTVKAAILTNASTGAVVLQGNAGSGAANQATLAVTGANSNVIAGTVRVLGDADLALAIGITNVASTGTLQLAGAEARVSLGANTANTALGGLAYNAGTVDFEGDTASGYGGTSVTTTGHFTNVAGGRFWVDESAGSGGSAVTIGGALVNAGSVVIGNATLGLKGSGGSTTVTATSLENSGSIQLLGAATIGAANQATLNIAGAAGSTSTGAIQVCGDATLKFASGAITSIGRGGALELDGAQASVLSGASSALSGLTENDGTLTLRGGSGYGAGGASLATTASFANNLDANVDATSGDGGSAVTFGGTLTNAGAFTIGNATLSASTTVRATALANSGTLIVQGAAASVSTSQAKLALSAADASTLAGAVRVSGDAALKFSGGGVASIGAGGSLELDGALARVLSGPSSALPSLTENDGTLTLRGASSLGAGGVSLTTTSSFTNNLDANVDATSGDGGSAVTFGGTLTNAGTLAIGNATLGGAANLGLSTSVRATTLANSGTLVLQGNAASLTSNQASLVLSGAADSTLAGAVRVGGDATLQFGGGGITTIAASSSLELDGAHALVLTGGGASSALSGLTENDGTLTLRGASTLGAGGASLSATTSFTNDCDVNVDATGGDGGSAVTFGGTLNNAGALAIGNADLGGAVNLALSTTVSATALVNNGALTLQGAASGGTTNKASLVLTGAAPSVLAGAVRVAGDAELRFGSGVVTAIGAGSSLELDGSQAAVTTGGGASSALVGLAENDGALTLQGRNSSYGAGGAILTTTTAFNNVLKVSVDATSGDGGSAVTFGGTLTNAGPLSTLTIGNASLSASDTINATTLANHGALIVQGNATGGTLNEASLILSGAAVATLTGTLRISGDATLQFGGGGITRVGAGSSLELDGSQAAIRTGASSALSGLATNRGTLTLQGRSGLGAGGAILTTAPTTAFANYSNVNVDTFGSDGGSAVTFGGTLVNAGAFDIGNAGLSASTTVSATTLVDSGSLILQGNAASATASKASLALSGAAAPTIYGSLRVSGDASLQFGGGALASIAHGGALELDGSQAVVTTNGGASSALLGLATNDGVLTLQGGNASYGAGGASLTTTTSFTNYLTVNVDASGGDGGSAVVLGGALTNSGALTIGNASLTASTSVQATTLASSGALVLQGNATSGTTRKASLVLSGAAAPTIAGTMRVSGDATLQFGSGGMTSIGNGGALELDGSQAAILTGGGASSALSGLAVNSGTLTLQGRDTSLGAGGAALTTATSFTNDFDISIDAYSSYTGGDGGSSATFGGTLTNSGALAIGNAALSASTAVSAAALVNTGTLTLQGNASSGSLNKASLTLSGGAAPSTLAGAVRIGGDATLQYFSGAIASIGRGAALELDGSLASIAIGGAAANSAISGSLATNTGTLTLQGDSSFGAGGVTLTTTKAFTNSVNTYVDAASGDGGSTVTFGGALTNAGTFDIGNTALGASTSVAATTLANVGALVVQGATTSGTTSKAGLDIAGSNSAPSTLGGSVRVGGDATLQFGSSTTQTGGGIAAIGLGASLELDGSAAQIQTWTGAGLGSALSGLAENDGTLTLRGRSSLGAGGASLTTATSFTNNLNVNVDTTSGDGGSALTFGGTLTNEGTLDIGNTSPSATTLLTASGLINDGAISLLWPSNPNAATIPTQTSAPLAEILVDGDAATSGVVDIGPNAEIKATGTFTVAGGTVTVGISDLWPDGALAASAIDVNDGLLDYKNPFANGRFLGNLNIGPLGTAEFDSVLAAGNTVTFSASTGGTLALGNAAASAGFDGSIAGFSFGDAIDLLSQPITQLAYSGSGSSGTLTVTGATGTIATLGFNGAYTTSSFAFASDGRGGSEILHT